MSGALQTVVTQSRIPLPHPRSTGFPTPLVLFFFQKNIDFLRKTLKNARKICIIQIFFVPLRTFYVFTRLVRMCNKDK